MRLSKKDFLSLADFTRSELEEILSLAIKEKGLHRSGKLGQPLEGRTLALLFHKPSLRTRASFEVAMHQLGGNTIYLTEHEIGIGSREAPQDVARVLSRYVSGIMIRTFDHELVELIAEWSTVPVINGLTDLLHPCQVLADLMTIMEHRGHLNDLTVAFIGDANNVARSWINAASKLSFKFILASPPGYSVEKEFTQRALGGSTDRYEEIHDPFTAVKEADVLYSDVWASMGQEAEAAKRKKDFAAFQINRPLIDRSPPHSIIMHCLPAHRGEEITDEAIESKRSVVFDQAENRLHVQRTLLSLLISS
jgi:ornithine carbamoyltransferase